MEKYLFSFFILEKGQDITSATTNKGSDFLMRLLPLVCV